MNSNAIRQVLDIHPVCFIRFEKLNGETRNMICTTHNSMIPKNKRPMGIVSYDTDRQIRVFDIVAQEWRSMIADNVEEIMEYGAVIAPHKVA